MSNVSCCRNQNKVLLTAILLLAVGLVHAVEFKGTVVGVSDGDTITVRDAEQKQHRIRLSGIDAPEKRQAFGDRSRQHLAKLTFQKTASLDCYKTDRYKRQICHVWVEERDVALGQLQAGLAWHYKRFEREQTPQERVAYAKAENDARTQGIGLWQDKKSIPPWSWRNGHQ